MQKLFNTILISLGFLTSNSNCQDPIGVRVITRVDNTEVVWLLNELSIGKSQWDGRSDPPNKLSDTIKSAFKGLEKIYGVSEGYEVDSIELNLLVGSKNIWFYVISFNRPYEKRPRGPSIPLKVVVVMSGSVLEPSERRKLDPKGGGLSD